MTNTEKGAPFGEAGTIGPEPEAEPVELTSEPDEDEEWSDPSDVVCKVQDVDGDSICVERTASGTWVQFAQNEGQRAIHYLYLRDPRTLEALARGFQAEADRLRARAAEQATAGPEPAPEQGAAAS